MHAQATLLEVIQAPGASDLDVTKLFSFWRPPPIKTKVRQLHAGCGIQRIHLQVCVLENGFNLNFVNWQLGVQSNVPALTTLTWPVGLPREAMMGYPSLLVLGLDLDSPDLHPQAIATCYVSY